MPEVRIENLINKLNKIQETLIETIEDSLLESAKQLQDDIATGLASTYAPTWASIRGWNGQQYLKTHMGLLEKIGESPINFIEKDNGEITVGIGHIPTLDELTVMDSKDGKGFPYWRLFEYGQGQRVGGSTTHTFFTPMRGTANGGMVKSTKYGRRGDGYSVPLVEAYNKDPKDWKGGPLKIGTKGIRPVHMFSETLDYWRPTIRKYLILRIKEKLQKFR